MVSVGLAKYNSHNNFAKYRHVDPYAYAQGSPCEIVNISHGKLREDTFPAVEPGTLF